MSNEVEAARAMREMAAKYARWKLGQWKCSQRLVQAVEACIMETPLPAAPSEPTAEGQERELRAQLVTLQRISAAENHRLIEQNQDLTEETETLRSDLARMKAALEEISMTHDGNPPMAIADMPELDYARRTIGNMRACARDALKGTSPTTDAPYAWRDMKDVPKDQDVILYFSTGTCRVPLVARYDPGFMDPIGLVDWRVIQPIPGPAPTGWLPLIWKD